MRIAIGRRARSSISIGFAQAKEHIRQLSIYQKAAAGIYRILPARFFPLDRTTANTRIVNDCVDSLSKVIELTVELRVQNGEVEESRFIDEVRQAEAEATTNIFGKAYSHLCESVLAFAKNIVPSLLEAKNNPKQAIKDILINRYSGLAMATAAFYGLGFLLATPVSHFFVSLAATAFLIKAITITAVTSTFGVFAFGSMHSVHPSNPTLAKIAEYSKTWGLLGSLGLSLLTVPYLIHWSDLIVGNILDGFSSGEIGGFVGSAAAYIAIKIIKSSIDFAHSRMSMDESPHKWKAIKMSIASNLAYYAKLGILSYIVPMYISSMYGFLVKLSHSYMPILYTTTITGAYYIGKWALNKNRSVKDGAKNIGLGMAIGTLPLLYLGGTNFFDFPTLFFFAPLCMIAANFHAGLAAMSSASSHERSMYDPENPPITDSAKSAISYGPHEGKGRLVTRVDAMMNNLDTNFSSKINMLTNYYPGLDNNLCEERKPWESLAQLKNTCAGKDAHAYRERWKERIYDFIDKQFKQLEEIDPHDQERLKKEYERLAWVFERIGAQLISDKKSFEDPSEFAQGDRTVTPFIAELMQLYKEDALSLEELEKKTDRIQTRTSDQKWFDHDLDFIFYAVQFETMQARALGFFFPMAERFENRAEEKGTLSVGELKKEYLRLRGCFSIRTNHIIRRVERHDDQTNQKSNNLAFVLTHGDTLCKLDILSEEREIPYSEYIPANFVCVYNPAYGRKEGAKRFLHIPRKDAKKIHPFLEFSRSGSEEIEYVEVAPTGKLTEITEGKYKGIKVFESDEERLPIKGLILRDFKKDGTTAADRLKGKLIWNINMAESGKHLVTGWDESTRKAKTEAIDRFGFGYDSRLITWALRHYMGLKNEEKLQKILARYEDLCTKAAAEGFDPLKRYLELYLEEKIDEKDKLGQYLKITNGKLWFEDPGTLVIQPPELDDYWFISDEEYIDEKSYIEHQSELQHEAKIRKNLRVFDYRPREHELPYPCPKRDVEHILHIKREGAPIEIGYHDEESGTGQIIPYQENRILLPKGKMGSDELDGGEIPSAELSWETITHAKAAKNENGGNILKLYSFTGKPGEEMVEGVNFQYVSTIHEEDYPDHLPPPDRLKGQVLSLKTFSNLSEDPEDRRIGTYGYMVFDFGENYGKEPWQRYRFVRETEKPGQIWLNLITKMELTEKGKLRVESLYPEAKIFPYNRPWINPGKEGKDRLDVIEVSDSRNRVLAKYKRDDGTVYYEYAPSAEQLPEENRLDKDSIALKNKSALGLVKFEKDGKIFESVFPVTGDLKGYHNPYRARDVMIGYLNKNRDQVKVVEGRPAKLNPDIAPVYTYHLKDHSELIDLNEKAIVINNYDWIKDTYIYKGKNSKGEDTFIVRITLENEDLPEDSPKRVQIKEIDGRCLVDEEGKELLKNKSEKMDTLESFFQKRKEDGKYSPEVELYQPEFSTMDGLPTLHLRATRKARKSIELSEESQKILNDVLPPEAKNIEVFISSPTSGVKVWEMESGRERWVPLSLVKPVELSDAMKGPDFSPGKMIFREYDSDKQKYIERVEYTENVQALKEKHGSALYEEDLIKEDSHTTIANGVLAGYFGGLSDKKEIVDRLNEIIKTRNLYEEIPEDVEFGKETKLWLKKLEEEDRDLSAEEKQNAIQGLNRLIVEDLHLHEIRKVYFEEGVVFRPDIIHGDFSMVVHRQTSYGGNDAAEVRDQYFYARYFGPGCEIRYPKGEFDDPRVAIGLQKGKTTIYDANRVLHSDTIESGTPFMMTYRVLYELMRISGIIDRDGKLVPANIEAALHHPFAQKIALYLTYSGVLSGQSEDELSKRVLQRATGRRLVFRSKTTARVAQPMPISKLKAQNLERYMTSAQIPKEMELPHIWREFWHGWIKHDRSRTYEPKELLEVLMTYLWYPGLAWSETGQTIGPQVNLLSGGMIQPYIVEHLVFLSFLLSDMPLSSVNYGLARYHGGFSPSWSFWHGPARDPISLLGGYWRGSRRMMKEDWQYAQFVVTALQKGKALPDSYKSFIRFFKDTGGASTTLGLLTLASSLALIGLSTASVFAILAVFFNTFWGGYKYFLTKSALKWLKIQEMDLKQNPQVIEDTIKKLKETISEKTTGRERIFSLLGARRSAATTLLDLGFDPFEVRNDPSRHNEQRRELLNQAFIIDRRLLEEAKALGESKHLEDRLQAMTVLKHLGQQSFSHDVGYFATRAYKRVIIDRNKVSKLFGGKIQDLRDEADKSDIDLKQISATYFTAVSAWDQLGKKERHILIRILKRVPLVKRLPGVRDKHEKILRKEIGRKLTRKVIEMIGNEKVVKADDLLRLADIVGQIQPLLPVLAKTRPLLVRMLRRLIPRRLRKKLPQGIIKKDNMEKINSAVREKIEVFQQNKSLENASEKELNLLYSIAALGCNKENIAQANHFKTKILDELYERAQKDYQKDCLPQARKVLSHLDKFSDKKHPSEELCRICEELIETQKDLQLKRAKRDTQIILIEEHPIKLRKDLKKIREALASGDSKKAQEAAGEVRKLGKTLINNILKENSKRFDKLMDLQKEIAILAPHKKIKKKAKQEIRKLFDKQLGRIEKIKNLETRAAELKQTVELLTGYAGIKDEELSFEYMPQLEFISKEIIPKFSSRIIEIMKSCGSRAFGIAVAKGQNPDFGSLLDRALGLKKNKLGRKRGSDAVRATGLSRSGDFRINRREKAARATRRIMFENLLEEAQSAIEEAKKKKSFNKKLANLSNRLLDLSTDLRATKLAEEWNGIIDYIQKLLTLERESLLNLRARAIELRAEEQRKKDEKSHRAFQEALKEYKNARNDYKERIKAFRGTIKIFVDKKHLKRFQIADVYPVPDRYETPEQKKERDLYFELIQNESAKAAEGGN